MNFSDIKNRAVEVQKKYNAWNESCGNKWSAREYAEGLMIDAGDLMRLIQAKSGFRKIDDIDAKIEHEISDCLWSVLVIADQLGIDLETVFMEQMDVLEKRIDRGEG